MRTLTLGLVLNLLVAVPTVRAETSSHGWEGATRAVALGEQEIVVLDLHGEVWLLRPDGVWRQPSHLKGDWADIAAVDGELLLLDIAGRVFASSGEETPRLLFTVPAGVHSLAANRESIWLAGRASADERVTLWRRNRRTGETTSLELDAPVTPFEQRELARGLAVERQLFNRVTLVPAGEGFAGAFRFRDLILACTEGSCVPHPWRSPRTELLATKPLGKNVRHPPLKSVASVAATASGDIYILPTFTDWDPETGAFDQRDEVIRLSARGEALDRCPLPGRAAGLVARRKGVFALLESGRLTPVCR